MRSGRADRGPSSRCCAFLPIDGTIVPVPPDFLHRLWSSFPREKKTLFQIPGGCSLQPVSTSSPLPTSFLSSFFTWKKVQWLLAVLQECPVHKDGDVTSIRELRRQGDKLAESLHLLLSIFHLHLASMSQVLPILKLPILAQEWAH